MVFIIYQDQSGGLPTADYCAQVRDQIGLTMPVLYDGDGSFAAAYNVIGSELNVITDEGGSITYWGYGDFTVEDELRTALGLDSAAP